MDFLDPVSLTIFGLMVAFYAAIAWAMFTNDKAHRQRLNVLNAVFSYRKILLEEGDLTGHAAFRRIFEENWEAVTYATHHFDLLTLRNPMKRYDFGILAVVEWHKNSESPADGPASGTAN